MAVPTYPPPSGAPPNYIYPPTHKGSLSVSTFEDDGPKDYRSRTPSPTVSEFEALHPDAPKRPKPIKQRILLYAAGAVVLTGVILISVFHEKIINALHPATEWLQDHKVGPLIPIALLIIMSFPPIFGHELIAMLVGVTWDLPEAFLIVGVGVLLGEIANFVTFKFCCTARSKGIEKSKLSFALLAHVVRKGGFLVVLVIRYSAIPPHFATAVFSTVGLGFGTFIAAAILSLPKTFVPVYIGWAMRPENDDNSTSSRVEKIILIISIGITIFALTWIRRQMSNAKEEVIYLRRKARQGKV
ncbi:hypothetical protein FB45DRAFT_1053955 [Roridomyces roridus]|uniref:Golgi apparatus membrane protein TVP38 n=1 Tax=Roridomyces roridus TaxID=1738132 RepID=A0AAD7FT30_9AGAR|nr:hypothetical protein FB45DRAFT_1053955 [Roridomyces roridus]